MTVNDIKLDSLPHPAIIGVGAGGHAKSIIDIISEAGDFSIVGLLDADKEKWGQLVLNIPILGSDEMLVDLAQHGIQNAFIGIGGVGSNRLREKLFQQTLELGFTVHSPIHPAALVSRYAKLGEGVHVLAFARINADATVGNNVIVNTGAIVEHDCVIHDHVHIATGATLSGGITVGRSAHIGTSATIRQSISIGEGAIVGAGAVVVKDVPPFTTVVGVPARIIT
ncbi:MAG: acetyltransferase [Anaerolineae bacterium]